MTPKERNEIRDLAAKKHNGDLDAAVCEWLGVGKDFKTEGGVPNGNVGAVLGIKDELEQYAEADASERNPLQSSNTGGEGGSGNGGGS